jgi:hypothetical protein
MPETSTFRRSGSDVVQRQYQIPGYTGFIRNAEEVQGRPYSRSTERALNNDVSKLVVGDRIPSSPQASTKILVCGE